MDKNDTCSQNDAARYGCKWLKKALAAKMVWSGLAASGGLRIFVGDNRSGPQGQAKSSTWPNTRGIRQRHVLAVNI